MEISSAGNVSQQKEIKPRVLDQKTEQLGQVPEDRVEIGKSEPEMADLTIPLTVPKEMITPDKDGNRPIDDYMVQLMPKDSTVVSQDDIQQLVKNARESALPSGMKPAIADSPAGSKVEMGKQLAMKFAQLGGTLGLYSTVAPGGVLSTILPAAVALPLMTIGGVLGGISAIDQVKKSLDSKHYLEGLKAQGVTEIPVPIMTKKDGNLVQGTENVPIDKMIRKTKDATAVGSLTAVGSGLMVAVGLGAPPAVAVAAVALGIGTFLYGSREKIAESLKKIGHAIADKFHIAKSWITGDNGEKTAEAKG